MRDLRELDYLRFTEGEQMRFGRPGGKNFGVFQLRLEENTIRMIADAGKGWEHVSVTVVDHGNTEPTRCPTWEEMDATKRLFFKDHETAFQFHVPVSDHVNIHPFCLHLWRPVFKSIPLPQAWRV